MRAIGISVLAAATVLVACAPENSAPPPSASQVEALKTVSGPTALELAVSDQEGAFVSQVVQLQTIDARIYGVVGGDPAINGVFTYLAVFDEPIDAPQVYRIGNFNEFELVSEQPGQATLLVSRSEVDQASGDVRTYAERLVIDIPVDASNPRLTVLAAD
jgi:hypothetical protein